MPEGQRHLTHTGRCRIHATGKGGHSDAAIARRPGRDRTTVWRGVRRNSGRRGQRHGQAQGKAEARRRAAPSVPRGMMPELWALVEERLADGWSPARIPGGCALGPSDGGPAVDPAARPRRPEGRGPALAASAPQGKEAGPQGRSPRGPRPHPGAGGHLGAPGAGKVRPRVRRTSPLPWIFASCSRRRHPGRLPSGCPAPGTGSPRKPHRGKPSDVKSRIR